MRTRSNYGIIGPVQTVTTSTTGLSVSVVDQQLLKSTGNWLSPPGAPTSVSGVAAGSGIVSVSFTAPASNGGSAITSYTVTSSPGNITATGSSSPITVTGLTNGTSYTFTVRATNNLGTSAASSPSGSVTPIDADFNISPAVGGVSNWKFSVNGTLSITSPGEYTVTWYNSTSKVVKMWGGAGQPKSGGSTGWGAGRAGRAGTGTVSFTGGTTYYFRVGDRGSTGTPGANAFGAGAGGGVFTGGVGTAGSGGGYTGIFRTSVSQANAILMAGGGGGGSSDRSDGLGGRSGAAGGGTTGQLQQGGGDYIGQPGTQANGGAAQGGGSPTSGSALQGGAGSNGGAGGGGGYYGGGGGGTQGDGGYGGGGGSGYYNPTYVTSQTLYIGSGTTPGNNTDADRPTNAGGGNTAGSNSYPGAIIVKA